MEFSNELPMNINIFDAEQNERVGALARKTSSWRFEDKISYQRAGIWYPLYSPRWKTKIFFFFARVLILFLCLLVCLFVCFSRVPPRSCILCTMSSMEIRSLTSGYRIKDGELKGRNAEVSILEGKIDFNNSACKESRSDAWSVGMGISALAWWIYGRFATTETLPPANSRPQFNVQFNYKNEKLLVANWLVAK